MNKYKETFGVDISKDVFDVHASNKGHNQYKNDETGFKKYLKELPEGSLVVMEATGYYHYRLAQFLYKNKVVVSVVNPLSIKRFIQMKLAKEKTDKSDATAICEYALIYEVPLYNACKHNKACKEVYERIVNKGKSKKLALIAVANKLIKQSFAIAKSGRPYDETHVSILRVT